MSVNRKGTKAFALMISAATSMLVIGCSSSTDDGPTMPTTHASVSKTSATTTTTKSSDGDNPFGFSMPSDFNSPPDGNNDSNSGNDDSDNGSGGSDSGPTLEAATGAYPGDWKGGGRTMTLSPDGNGTMKLDDSEYVIAWAPEGAGITVTIKSITVNKDGSEKVGKIWHGALQKDPDSSKTVLHLADKASDLKEMFSGMFWCNNADDSFLCGGGE
ncbi:MAG: hypothetical protein LLG14_01230 [Nocardiaceae bacterium]|nr:hypothetical protein [Nocardiaceae bacterium]